MSKRLTLITGYIFAILCVIIGLYPLTYFIIERTFGLLSFKSEALLQDTLWNVAFYAHIILGAISLLLGWTQFNSRLRKNKLHLHRNIGKVYMIAVLLSGLGGLYISFFATGGMISTVGFGSLAVIWLAVTFLAYQAVRKKNIAKHQKLMIFSYACCFAAVTLRIWMPLLISATGDFITGYRMVAWLCWVPNILIAFIITRNISHE